VSDRVLDIFSRLWLNGMGVWVGSMGWENID
jgi:hypothetical protein